MSGKEWLGTVIVKRFQIQSLTLINCEWLIWHKLGRKGGLHRVMTNEGNALLALSDVFLPYII